MDVESICNLQDLIEEVGSTLVADSIHHRNETQTSLHPSALPELKTKNKHEY